MRLAIRALALVLAIALLRAELAYSGTSVAVLKLNATDTRITFTLKGNTHNVEGSFQLKRGEITVDPDTGKAHGTIMVDAASGRTGNSRRDARMRDSILEAQRFPDISFIPRHAQNNRVATGTFTEMVSGTFILHGDRHDATLWP